MSNVVAMEVDSVTKKAHKKSQSKGTSYANRFVRNLAGRHLQGRLRRCGYATPKPKKERKDNSVWNARYVLNQLTVAQLYYINRVLREKLKYSHDCCRKSDCAERRSTLVCNVQRHFNYHRTEPSDKGLDLGWDLNLYDQPFLCKETWGRFPDQAARAKTLLLRQTQLRVFSISTGEHLADLPCGSLRRPSKLYVGGCAYLKIPRRFFLDPLPYPFDIETDYVSIPLRWDRSTATLVDTQRRLVRIHPPSDVLAHWAGELVKVKESLPDELTTLVGEYLFPENLCEALHQRWA
jgi:hypothetical protein